jgi:hypothetical protein
MHKKVRLADSDLGPVVLSILIKKKLLFGKGKIMEVCEKCGFSHDFA